MRKVGHREFFDLTVPRAAHYFAEGFIHHNSSKTYSISKYIITDWWADPMKRLWLVSSTEKRGAELRIWGKIKEFFNRARKRFPWLPGKVLESKNCITPSEISDDGSEGRLLTQGIMFVPMKSGSTFTGLLPWVGVKPPPGGKLGHAGDECFPAGTLVDTPSGPRTIETIQVGQRVINAVGTGIVIATRCKDADSILRIETCDNRVIQCTPNHKIMTAGGWMKAEDLRQGVYLLSPCETTETAGGTEMDVLPIRNGSLVRNVRAVVEQGCVPVYNLHVEEHHSYSVNGIVVKNCQLMMHGFLDAYANWYGKENFQGILTGNPGDLEDPLCTAAEPADGWDNWKDDGKTQQWKSKFYGANVLALDGRDTPNNDFPYINGKPRFPYLIGKKKLDSVKALYGDNDWHWWHQCVGKPQTSVQARRVITRAIVEHNHAYDEPIWQDGNRTKVCSLDAAYGGVGGDRCVIMPGEFGKEVGGKTVLAPGKWELVPVSVANNPKQPEIQIAEFCKDFCESKGIPPENFFFDGRGTLAVAMARIWSPEVNVVDFGGPATDRPVSNDEFIWDGDKEKRLKLCSEHYFNFVTELWFSLHYLIISGQMKNLDREVARESFKRTWDMTRNNKIQVEPKKDMKERTLQSPDLVDCFVEGTMVETVDGPKPIENIRIGDLVVTPLGNSPVIMIHQQYAPTTKVYFSNGSMLEGKGKHRIFTWNEGWIRLDTLHTRHEIEPYSSFDAWKQKNASFIRTANIGFKAMVDIFHATGSIIRRSDFYTELYGRNITEKSQKDSAFITRMETGRITESRILNSLSSKSIAVITCANGLNGSEDASHRLEGYMPQNGIVVMLELNGIERMERGLGSDGLLLRNDAKYATRNLMLSSSGLDSARSLVTEKTIQERCGENRANARYVERNSSERCTQRLAIVRPIAGPLPQPGLKKVYNLTLLEHNAYYANGILVDNCLVTLLEGTRRLGLEISSSRSITLVTSEDYLLKELAKYDKIRKASSLKYDTAH